MAGGLNSTDLRACRWAVETVRRGLRQVPPSVERVAARLPGAIAAVEQAEMSASGPGFGFNPEELMSWGNDSEPLDVPQVAVLLGVTERHVRRRAEALGGRKVAGRWLFPAQTIAEHLGGAHCDRAG